MSFLCDDYSGISKDFDATDLDLAVLDDVSFLDDVIDCGADQVDLKLVPLKKDSEETKCPPLRRKPVHKSSTSRQTIKISANGIKKERFNSTWVPYAPPTSISTPQIVALFEAQASQMQITRPHYPRPQASLSDPLFFFTIAVINSLNSADNMGLSNLFHAHMSQQCSVGIYSINNIFGPTTFLKYFEVMNQIHVDRVFIIKSTSIVNGHITVTTDVKFTDCKVLHDGAPRPQDDPLLMSFFATRAHQLRCRVCMPDQSEDVRQQLLTMVESHCDLAVCARIQFHVKYDEGTNKVRGLYMTGGLTSVQPAVPLIMEGECGSEYQ